MKNVINGLNKLLEDYTGKSNIRVIIKKNLEQCSIKAYKKLTIQMYLHIPNKNVLCLTVSDTFNTSKLNDDEVWSVIEPYFVNEVLKLIFSGKYKQIIDNTLNGVQI